MQKTQKRQRGVSLGGLIIVLFILVMLGLLGLKVIPPYMEYSAIKNAVVNISQERATASMQDIRRAFDSRAAVDDFKAVNGADLEITKEGGQLVISASYRKEVPLFLNLGIYWDFVASSKEP